MSYSLRTATRDDLAEIAEVMRESLRELGREVYSPRQVASAMEFVGRPDGQLIDDGTYFVAVADGAIVGCGGWSRRRKPYAGSAAAADDDELLDPARDAAHVRAMFVRATHARQGIGRAILELCEQRAAADGFRRLQLVALRSGERMYAACGYVAAAEEPVTLKDGVILECTLMEKTLPRS
ncbi:MAG TPA: GNAT family N-acetyltransferase [Thermoanaerobaculia bacterium]|jgi:GNAT superfamily N-acetyltransferase|nr:GNAT family N-acetyltransferase [Thermoanaerobaculia bacterium]